MKIFYFTGTGNSLYVAKRIGDELYSIPKMIKENNFDFEDEIIGFVFPCHSFRAPRMVVDFIEKSSLKANYYFAIMTYGNIASSGLEHIEKIGYKKGITFNYTNEILMIDNYLPFFDIKEQLNKENKKNIEENLLNITNDIKNKRNYLIRKTLLSKILSQFVWRLYSSNMDTMDNLFIVNDNCNGCKICETVCPKRNIIIENKPEFLHKCENCYACIHNCPQNAIHLKSEKSNLRFINQNITLKEIISSNS